MKISIFHLKPAYLFVLIFLWAGFSNLPLPNVSARTGSIEILPQSENIVFAVIGDYGSGEQQEADVATLVKSWNPDFIVTVGDNNYPIGAAYTIDENIGQYFHDYIYPYNGKYGAGASYKKFFPALGNHDWMSNGATPYFNYFSFYNKQGYYDFIQGPVHFYILDSDPNEPDGNSSTSKQAKWLKNGLAASTSQFNIVVMHHPPYSSGMHGSTSNMQWPYKSWGADAVLAGHDHVYERIIVDGLPYFVNGLGGEDMYGFGTILPGSQVRFNQDFGAMRVEANSMFMKFQFFTRAGILVDEYSINKISPSVSSIIRVSPSPSNANSVDYAVTFSEPVIGVDISDFILTTTNTSDATISSVNGASSSYSVTVNTGSIDNSLRLDLLDDDSIINSNGISLGGTGLGNGNFNLGESYSIDKSAPVVMNIIRGSPNPTNAASVDFLVTFSEPVFGVDISDLSLASNNSIGVSITNLNGLDTSYVITVNTTPSNNTLRLDLVDNDSITDLAGNNLGGPGMGNGNFVQGESYSINRTVPVVKAISMASPNPSNAQSLDFAVSFSEPVTGVDPSDFVLTANGVGNPFINNISGSGSSYIISVNTGTGDGALRLDLIDEDTILNDKGYQLGGTGIGNGNFINGDAYTLDKTAPAITSIIRAGPNPSNSAKVDFIATFSEPVNGVDATDFKTVMAGIYNASIANVINVDPFYIVTVNTGIGTGDLGLDLLDDDSILDHAGNSLGGPSTGNGSFATGEIFKIAKDSVNFPPPAIRGSRRDFLTNNPSPTFSWTVVRGAPAYEIFIAADNSFNQIAMSQITNELSYSANPPLSDGNYYWRVRAYNSDLQPGRYSQTRSFTIDTTPPPAPILINPLDNSTSNAKPSFQWQKNDSAVNYQIEIDNDKEFSSPEFSATRQDTTYRPSKMKTGVYYWRVRAKDRAGNWSSWSAAFTINIQ